MLQAVAQPTPWYLIGFASLIVSALTLALNSLLKVPGSVRKNDELVQNRNEDLRTWVEDDDVLLEQEIAAKLQVAVANGVVQGGAPIQSRDKITAVFEHRYRDQLRTAQRVVREARLSESWTHRAYRRFRRTPYAPLTAPSEVAEILKRWSARKAPALKLHVA